MTPIPVQHPPVENGRRLLQGNHPLLLGDRHVAWTVDDGSAAVFVVDLENGEPKGPRRYLFTVKAGDVLLGMSGAQGSRHQELLAVPIEVTHIVPTAADESAITAWISRLSLVLADLCPEGSPAVFADDRRLSIDAGRAAVFQDQVTWLRTVRGRVRLLGYPEGTIDQPGVCFVMGRGLWIEAEESADLERTARAANAADAFAVLEVVIFRALDDLDRRQVEAQRSRARHRRELDRRLASDVVHDLASVIMNADDAQVDLSADPPLLAAARAVGQAEGILVRPPVSTGGPRHPLDAIALRSGMRTRRVLLAGHWWEGESGSLLAYQGSEQQPVALLQGPARVGRRSRYVLFDPARARRTPVDAEVASTLHPVAVSFYRPFGPDLSTWGLIRFGAAFHGRDIGTIVLCGLAISLLGMAAPEAGSILFSQAIPDGDLSTLWQVGFGLGAAVLGVLLFQLAQAVAVLRLQTAANVSLQAGVWDRLLKLSPAFFRRFTVGDLQVRAEGVSIIQQLLTLEAFRAIVGGAFSTCYLLLMLYYSVPLGLVATAAGAVVLGATALSVRSLARLQDALQAMAGDLFGLTIQLINGVPKLRVAGAEQRAFAHWGKAYAAKQKVVARIRRTIDRMHVLNVTVPLLAVGLSCWLALDAPPDGAGRVPLSTFVAFNMALGVFMVATTTLSNTLTALVPIRSLWRRTRTILDAPPDVGEGQSEPGPVQGRIHFDHVSFRYRTDGPLTLEDVSISVQPGECVALVGPSGSGKSTIVNLLLRFETPASGAIYLDGQDLSRLDIAAVRRQFGVVNQDSTLISASIFENIVCGGLATMEAAWTAARAAGLAEDIEEMPMGMHTLVSEGGTNISGGQRQRIMIARALVMKASILIFDEATSALDNHTQQVVTASLNALNVTRIVVAHRLSTIRAADRIYVIDDGRVVQAGTYDSLIQAPGRFAQLMKRQTV